jgi:hypothetical protein
MGSQLDGCNSHLSVIGVVGKDDGNDEGGGGTVRRTEE